MTLTPDVSLPFANRDAKWSEVRRDTHPRTGRRREAEFAPAADRAYLRQVAYRLTFAAAASLIFARKKLQVVSLEGYESKPSTS